jgi:hypothetical protein
VSAESKTIQLTTPALDSRANPDTLTKPHAVRDWVDNLPYANPLNMAKEVLSSLKLTNRHPNKITRRTDLMMIYMDPFKGIIEIARKIICQNQGNKGLNKNDRELVSISEAVCIEMAYGFKHIVNNELNSEIKITPEQCAQCIHLGIVCLSAGLLLDMSLHRPESQTAWREIFQLLMRAQQLGIAHQEISDLLHHDGYEISVLNSFKSILLTSILDPSRLTPREIWGAHDYLSWYAKNARLTSLEQAAQQPGNYLIARDGMGKPTLFNPDKPPSNPGRYMVLETHRLNLLISRHLDILLENNTAPIRGSEKLNPDAKMHLLRQMLHIWHNNPKRRHERKEKFDRVACAFGVGSVYQFLKEGTMRKPYQKDEPGDGAYHSHNISGPELSDILNSYECRQENISANGIMILSSDQRILKLKIGQIAVTESLIGETSQSLKIGVVRRIINRDQNTTEFGLQFIPGRLHAATVLPEIFGRKHPADVQPCILMELGKNKPKALITPNLTYQADRHYVLDVADGNTNRVIAGKMLESTACFDCFEYNVLEHC